MLGRDHNNLHDFVCHLNDATPVSLDAVPIDAIQSSKDSLRMGVLKISNISWDLTTQDIVSCMSDTTKDWESVAFDWRHVHIPIDRSTGKTKADMYVELSTPLDVLRLISRFHRKLIKGRAMLLQESSVNELYDAHYSCPLNHQEDQSELNLNPISPCMEDDDEADRPLKNWTVNVNRTTSDAQKLTILDVDNLLAICRHYKAHFSRKCAARPFEHVNSLLRLARWYEMNQEECDLMFHLVYHAIEALIDHLRLTSASLRETGRSPRFNMQLSTQLLMRMRQAAHWFVPFTESQLNIIDELIQNRWNNSHLSSAKRLKL